MTNHRMCPLGWNGHWVDRTALERFPGVHHPGLAACDIRHVIISIPLSITRVDSLGQYLAVVLPQPREIDLGPRPLWRK